MQLVTSIELRYQQFFKHTLQTFVDIISLAREKYLDELFEKKTVPKWTKKAEMGSDEEQPIRDNLYEWYGQ